jgi:hypothetical protein
MSIFPEKIVRSSGSDGTSFISEIYSLESWAEMGFWGIAFMVFFGTFISPFIAPIFLLFYCIEANKNPIGLNVIGIFLPMYLLIDMHKGWLISILMIPLFSHEEIQFIKYVSAASILMHILILLFGQLVYNLCGKSRIIFFVLICIASFFAYPIGKHFITHNITLF